MPENEDGEVDLTKEYVMIQYNLKIQKLCNQINHFESFLWNYAQG